MEFSHDYRGPPSHHTFFDTSPVHEKDAHIERPITASDIGATVPEGQRFGAFRQSINVALRAGASQMELQPALGGTSAPEGAGNYGQHAREELREIAEANGITFTSVHTPVQVGNLSGYNPQQGFSDEQRLNSVEEVKRAIDFAADVTRGGAIVVHTGEYARPMSEQDWAYYRDSKGNILKDADGKPMYMFLSYKEEPGRATTPMVDRRTGQVIGAVRKSQVVHEPKYRRVGETFNNEDLSYLEGRWVKDRTGKMHQLKRGDLLTADNQYLDADDPNDIFYRVPEWNTNKTQFETKALIWDDFERRAREHYERNKEKIERGEIRRHRAEDEFFRVQQETQMLQARGASLFHGQRYDTHRKNYEELQKLKEYYTKLEKQIPREELWKIMKEDAKIRSYSVDLRGMAPTESLLPTQLIERAIDDELKSMKYIHEASSAADAQADTIYDAMQNTVRIDEYAKKQTFRSMAELGVYSVDISKHGKHVNRPIYLAPEHIFPEMGYGSHPDEIIEYVKKSREEMVKFLTEKRIEDPHARIQLDKNGRPEIGTVNNPYYKPDISKEEAKKMAEQHIKATLDTQHLSMWRKHLQPLYIQEKGRVETQEELNKRFDKWYMEQIKKMHKEGIIGNIHIVDAIGTAHHHLPPGQGEFPVVEAVEWLKKNGYNLSMNSEGWGEDHLEPGRIISQAWAAFGSPVWGQYGPVGGGYGAPHGGPQDFLDVRHGYFGQNRPPYFVFGSYAPSNEWQLWSQVPME